MKGTIHKCLGRLISEKYGKDKWQECLVTMGYSPFHAFTLLEDVDESLTMEFFTKASEIIQIPVSQLADEFGEYWSCVYAPDYYRSWFIRVSSVRELLTKLDHIHYMQNRTIVNAHPPRFDYKWIDEKTLHLTYKSKRDLIDLFISLIKGTGKYFNEDLKITKLSNEKLEIIFP